MYVLEEMNDFSLKSIGFNLDQMYSRIFVAGKYTKNIDSTLNTKMHYKN